MWLGRRLDSEDLVLSLSLTNYATSYINLEEDECQDPLQLKHSMTLKSPIP